MDRDAAYWVEQLGLVPHPEGGYFQETYRCPETIPVEHLPERYTSTHSCSTAIYFLLESGQVSKFHRLRSDELWLYHAGCSLTLHVIEPDGAARRFLLGTALDKGEVPQLLMPQGRWFGATVNQKNSYALVSCVVAPGFDFEDFELATRKSLLAEHPQHQEIITRLT